MHAGVRLMGRGCVQNMRPHIPCNPLLFTLSSCIQNCKMKLVIAFAVILLAVVIFLLVCFRWVGESIASKFRKLRSFEFRRSAKKKWHGDGKTPTLPP